MDNFKKYRRTNIAEMVKWTPGIDLDWSLVSISAADVSAGSPKEGDMIARNPENHDDMWLVAKEYFISNFELMDNTPMGGPITHKSGTTIGAMKGPRG